MHIILLLLWLAMLRPYTHGISNTVSLLSISYSWNPSTASIPWMWQILNAFLVFTFSAPFSYGHPSPAASRQSLLALLRGSVSPQTSCFLPSVTTCPLSCFWNITPHFQLARGIGLHSLFKLSNMHGFPLAMFPQTRGILTCQNASLTSFRCYCETTCVYSSD